MKQGAGKRKGGGWEREFAMYLTKWLTGQNKEYYFYRSPSSGAIATVRIMNHTLAGDIIAVREEAMLYTDRVCFECKTGYVSYSLDKFFKGNKNDLLEDFWTQVTTSADKKFPMIIFQRKGLKPWVITSTFPTHLRKIIVSCDKYTLQIMDMQEFFEHFDPKKFLGFLDKREWEVQKKTILEI